MASKVTLIATTFDEHVCGTKTHGFRMYDDYSQAYDNNSESPIEDDFDLLRYALTCSNSDIKAMLDFIAENEMGMMINSQFYDWEEIKDCFSS